MTALGDWATISSEVVAKAPGKKGTTKTRRHKVFSGPAQATPGRQKRLPLCLGVFVVQGFFAFCFLRLAFCDLLFATTAKPMIPRPG